LEAPLSINAPAWLSRLKRGISPPEMVACQPAVSPMNNTQLPPETRLHMLGARQAALTEVLEQFNRLTVAARAEATIDGAPPALESSWRRLHHWLAEAGRENLIELSLIRHEMASTIDQTSAAPKARRWLSASGLWGRVRSTLMFR
jgi:hypothetical protein